MLFISLWYQNKVQCEIIRLLMRNVTSVFSYSILFYVFRPKLIIFKVSFLFLLNLGFAILQLNWSNKTIMYVSLTCTILSSLPFHSEYVSSRLNWQHIEFEKQSKNKITWLLMSISEPLVGRLRDFEKKKKKSA